MPESQTLVRTSSSRGHPVGLKTTTGRGPSAWWAASEIAPSAEPRPTPAPSPRSSPVVPPARRSFAKPVSTAAATARSDSAWTVPKVAALCWKRPDWYSRVARTPEPGRMSWNWPKSTLVHASRRAATG